MAASKEFVEVVASLGTSLSKEVLDNPEPCPERCLDILRSVDHETSSGGGGNGKTKMTVAALDKSKIGKTLVKLIRSFKRHRRTSGAADAVAAAAKWDEATELADRLLSTWKEAAAAESAAQQKKRQAAAAAVAQKPGPPNSAAAYKARLVSQKKDMYKDPPAMPPPRVAVEGRTRSLPKRDKRTGELTFPPGEDAEVKKLLKDFRPNRTPEEVLRAGSFGGTYFRPITSAVTNVRYNASDVLRDTVEPSWIEGINKPTLLTSMAYRQTVNKYGVKCGGSLGMWESSGWIADSDPYGWFQWYCRFYRGRRCSDDARQISRWLKSAGPKGRFRSQLCNKCLAANKTADDASISPVIRQTLLHWGFELTPELLEKHRLRVQG